MTFQTVGKGDLQDLQAFLATCSLPKDDIEIDRGIFLFSRDESGSVIASGGIELYGGEALLRSVAINAALRSQHRGRAVVGELLERARERRVTDVYLLTETAPVFFEKLGFRRLPREDAPASIKDSTEFSAVCPVSATLMVYHL